ncbi:FMN-binding protein [Microbacterium sp. CFBP9034]|uniref:FMN-binding protein n=1 Tax=Microbacterium sp. CFBP9034 TaxID=3096540 RepID=UPI002A6B0AF6|nr:FMN-binding protein [Microbacterium sp. CFBP9034]MDY0911027.1 FMN-binding protein [Microbacterium sp. CFBP9034]
MIRTAVATRPARAGATLAAVAGIVLLAGCAPATDTPDDASTDTADGSSGADGAAAYADGTYTADGTYQTPESVETISVTVTLEDDVVTDVEVVGDPQKSESEQYQGQFIGGISDEVVGQDIDDISVSRVAGSSLTSGGFNQAIDAIKAEAAL